MRLLTFVFSALLLTAGTAGAQELTIRGFVEGAYGGRIQDNAYIERSHSINETRMQLKFSHYGEIGEFFSSVDLLSDNVAGGETNVNLREAYIQFGIGNNADIKAGRQVLTWGTGDLLFINDLFPKDYVSFFIGREDQYLKLPSDAVKLGIFSNFANVDLIAIPYFSGNRMPDGTRLSFFHPFAGGTTGPNLFPAPATPSEEFHKSEIAARVYRFFGSFQTAGYFYRGFYQNPMGIDPIAGSLYHPELTALGLSARGPVLNGVISAEYGYYDSRDDNNGDNPLVPNSQHRYLLGFERQWWTDFTLGMQYYGEYMLDYDTYKTTLPAGSPEFDELRQVFAARLTQQFFYQTLRLSLFTFYSPTDEDWHLRPNATYKYSDNVEIAAGGNLFGGTYNHTLFGQFEDNNNIYGRLRYYF